MDEKIKEAFSRVKEDISSLKLSLLELKEDISLIKRTIRQTDKPTDRQTDDFSLQTNGSGYSDLNASKGSKVQNINISTGNEGVQTDRQTNQQTDRQTEKFAQDKIDSIKNVSEIIGSLDTLRKELRSKFKKLTSQEMLVFSSIYQFSDEEKSADYSSIADKLSLSESSIRDYVQKIIGKGIPIEKYKENNKKVSLSIPADFKKLASLQTIISLREL